MLPIHSELSETFYSPATSDILIRGRSAVIEMTCRHFETNPCLQNVSQASYSSLLLFLLASIHGLVNMCFQRHGQLNSCINSLGKNIFKCLMLMIFLAVETVALF